MCPCCTPLIKAIDKYIQKADNELVDALGKEGYAKPDEIVDCMNEMEDGITAALKDETDTFVSAASRASSIRQFAKKVWPKISNEDITGKTIRQVVEPLFRTYIPRYTTAYIQMTDRQLYCERLSERTVDWIQRWAEDLGNLMKLDSHKQLEDILEKDLRAGVGIEEFTRHILESGIRDERYRARRVALTEVLTANRVAQNEAFMQSPAVEGKMWRHTGSYRNTPRENHVKMDGRRVKKQDPFNLRGADGKMYYPQFPGDTSLPAGERINCHCICQPVVVEDQVGLSLEERQKLQQEALDSMDSDWMKELDERNKKKAGIDPNAPGGVVPGWTPPKTTGNQQGQNRTTDAGQNGPQDFKLGEEERTRITGDILSQKKDSFYTKTQEEEFKKYVDGMTDRQLLIYNEMSKNSPTNLYKEGKKGVAFYHTVRQRVEMDISDNSEEVLVGTNEQGAWRTLFHEESHQLDHVLADMGHDLADGGDGTPVRTWAITSSDTKIGKELIEAIDADIIDYINTNVVDPIIERQNKAKSYGATISIPQKRIATLKRIYNDQFTVLARVRLENHLRDTYKTGKQIQEVCAFTDALALTTKAKIDLPGGFYGHGKKYCMERGKDGAASETFATMGSTYFRNDKDGIAVYEKIMPRAWAKVMEIFDSVADSIIKGEKIEYKKR